jgi:tungstate transport system substrate-binding protein
MVRPDGGLAMRARGGAILGLGVLVAAALAGCQRVEPDPRAAEASAPGTPACGCAGRSMKLATTTSVDSTGLLADLLPDFKARTGIEVQVLAVGTGQALRLAENGDVDAVLVHDPEAEAAFLAAGFGVHPQRLMHNDFILVGPEGDPAGVRGAADAPEALRRVAAQGAPFVSRGDGSGTHMAEKRLWAAAGATPAAPWYAEVGQGQAPALRIADEKGAYTLTDRATYLFLQDQLRLRVVVEGDPRLLNVYSFLAVPPTRFAHVKHGEALALCGYLASAEGQRRIGAFRVKGAQLFHPDLLPATEAPRTP